MTSGVQRMFDSCSGHADFDALRHSRRINGDALWLRFAADATLERPRIAFAVNAHYGKATQRNRLRRRLRHALGELRDQLSLGRYLLGTRGSIATDGAISYRRAVHDLETMLAKLARRAEKRPAGKSPAGKSPVGKTTVAKSSTTV